MVYEKLLKEVQESYSSGDFGVSYQDIANAAGCSKMNAYWVLKGRHKNPDVLIAAAKLIASKKRALIQAHDSMHELALHTA